MFITALETATRLRRLGYYVLPILSGTKACSIKNWPDLYISLADIPKYFDPSADVGVGILLGTEVADGVFVICVDIDLDDDLLIGRVRSAIGTNIPGKRGSKGISFFARATSPIKARRLRRKDTVTGGNVTAVEILGKGEQTVIPPSLHPKGMYYEWVGRTLLDTPPSALPIFDQFVMDEIEAAVKKPDSPIHFISHMTWQGDKGGGDVHNSTLSSVAAMVGLSWTDEAIWRRVDRATAEATARAGDPPDGAYDWPGWEDQVLQMAADARDKGFESGGVKKENPHLTAARWFVNEWRGPYLILHRNNQLWQYMDGYYSVMSERDVRHIIATKYPEPKNVSFVHSNWNQIARTALDAAPPFPTQLPHRRVCLTNGTFDMDTMELHPHSPEDYLISHVPYAYDPDAKCPIYEDFLDRTFASPFAAETMRSIQLYEEYVALTMFECLDFQKFLVILGDPNTGKSTLLKVIEFLHDKEAVSAVSLQDFSSERFRTHMLGKLVNVTGEIHNTSHSADDFLKSITVGDAVSVRHLYAEPFMTILPTRLVMTGNEMFPTRDTSGAVQRRMLVIRADNILTKDQVDIQLWSKLRAETSGIFNRMMHAWKRLRQRGEFNPPKTQNTDLERFTLDSNHVLQWFQERTWQGIKLDNIDAVIPSELPANATHDLYEDFNNWQRHNGFKIMSSVSWGTKLAQIARSSGLSLDSYAKRIPGGAVIKVRNLTLVTGLPKFTD